MATAVRMPRWGMIMEEGMIVSWLKAEGETVESGEILAEIESEKVTNELEAPASGVLARIVVPEGETANVGALIAVLAQSDDSDASIENIINGGHTEARHSTAAGGARKEASRNAEDRSEGVLPDRVLISPAAKRIAEEGGLDWRTVRGSGPRGRIQVIDVKAALEGAPASEPDGSAAMQTASSRERPAEDAGVPLSKLRRSIARRTEKSIEAPQAGLYREIDLTAILAHRSGLSGSEGSPPSLTAMILHRVIRALREVPVLNARFEDGRHVASDSVHIGVVVGIVDGVVVPVIREAQRMNLAQLDESLRDVASRAKSGELTTADVTGGTFTVSNAGMFGVDLFRPLLNPPEVAVLGIGRIRRRPYVVEDAVVPRDTAYFCVATDHRLVDAGPAGEFLAILDELCSRPGDG